MNRLLLVCLLPILFFCLVIPAEDAQGQGVLQRLRSRIGPIIANELDNLQENRSNNSLPARPLPKSGDGYADTQSGSGPAARYNTPARPGGVTRIPSTSRQPGSGPTPTPAPSAAPNGVAPAAANLPADASTRAQRRSGLATLGRSILSPLVMGNDETNESASQAASIGIGGVNANPGYPGVQITRIADYSLAGRDGLRIGDFIFAVDAVPTPSVAALAAQVAKQKPGDRVRLRIGRAGRVSDLVVELVAKPGTSATQPPSSGTQEPPIANLRAGGSTSSRLPALPPPPELDPAPTLAPTLAPSPAPLDKADSSSAESGTAESSANKTDIGAEFDEVAGRRGVSVTKVLPGSIAEQAGLQAKDRIVAVDRRMVSDSARLFELLASKSPGASADVQVIRNNQLVNLELALQESTTPGSAPAAKPSSANPESPAGGSDVNTSPDSQGSTGIVNGLGSVFGGLLGGGKNASSEPSRSKQESTAKQEGSAKETKTSEQRSLSEKIQTLELPAPIKDALFLQDNVESSSGERSAKASVEQDKAVREEIERLREKLKRLEEKLGE